MTSITPPVRGCGSRVPGGIYLVASLGRDGIPLETLVVDPPLPVDPTAIGLSAQGVAVARDRAGEVLVLDWVGQASYPNVADYLEEVSLFGSSRRVPKTFDFSVLTPKSRHLLVHPRALVTNVDWALDYRVSGLHSSPPPSFLARTLARTHTTWCPFRKGAHDLLGPVPREMCAALWWELLVPGSVSFGDNPEVFERQCQRALPVEVKMPSLTYSGYTLPDKDIWVPQWAPGIFLGLPISRIEIVKDPDPEGFQAFRDAFTKAQRASLPVIEVDA